ncbi:MAG TPA: hypothetical protein VF157_06050, partial [Chloroflexota bacterium]
AAIALWSLVELWQRDSRWGQAAALFAIGCAAQLHPQAAALLVVWLAVSLAKWRWGWPSGVAVIGLGLVLSPYLYLQAHSAWSDLRAAWQYLQQPKQFDGQALTAMASLFSARPYTDLLAPRDSPPAISVADPLLWFYVAALLAGLVLAFGRREPAGAIMAGCFVAPLLAAVNHSGEVAPHYLLVLLPSGCLLAAMALQALPSVWLGTAVLATSVVWAGGLYAQFQRGVPEALGSAYGMPLRYSQDAASVAGRQPGPVYVSNRDEEAGVLAYLLPGRAQKRFDGRYTFVLPQASTSYLADATLAFASGRLTTAGGPTQRVMTPGGQTAYGEFARAPAAEALAGMQPLDVDVAHSVRLIGYDAGELRAGGQSTVLLAWRVTDAHGPIAEDLRQFGHLVDASGHIWSGNPDFRGYPRPYWQDGDTVISAFDLHLPAGTPTGGYWFDTGFYEPISGQRMPQFRAGQPAGSSARIGPLKVSGVSPAAGDRQPLAVFGGQIALLGVQRTEGGITLRWQAVRKPTADYTVFVHVLDGQGTLLAQQDGPPREGSYPTGMWDAGEVVDDPHPLSFASQPGQKLEIGLYTFPDLRRLPVDGSTTDSLVLPVTSLSS